MNQHFFVLYLFFRTITIGHQCDSEGIRQYAIFCILKNILIILDHSLK